MSNLQLSPELLQQLPLLIQAEQKRRARNKIVRYYPEAGSLRRELYPKHLQFFAAGREYRERLMLAANRVGKTEGVGAYESTLHLTGRYPDWWDGLRFNRPVKAWAAGDTSKTVREIIQEKLMGAPGAIGTGMIPGDLIIKHTTKSGVADAIDTVYVKHASGGISILVLKSYDQRREAFQGTEQDLIWLDEEPPEDIWTECIIRTMTTGGNVMLTFTPINGWTEVVDKFVNEQKRTEGNRFCVTATWDDAPHLSEDERKRMWAALPPHQRDARAKGIPALGSGAIYPVPESDIVVSPFEIPVSWPRAYGLDVGWNRTAAVWGALDRETSTIYLYSEHYRGEAEPVVHTQAIRSRGEWIPGVIDPAARGRGQADGRRLLHDYVDLGLDLQPSLNAVEAGIYDVWTMLSAGRLKVFSSLRNWLDEFRKYRRDEDGKIVKENDHLMDATRYLILSGRERMTTKSVPVEAPKFEYNATGWMS